ncbi:hypothetical protein BDZ45DRAFT_680247 [Acephala macrosclerotiorum]|nr:hypothetical protein BDZ45DRAFT_680247 [Acephala macrosclerotiorum]
MVSFSCEACGDVLTKKKLDGHRNQCYGASYTCLDCMIHFQGNEYRSHTSCISEAQKYQGALYRPEKEKKNKQNNSKALVPHKAYVEDADDEYQQYEDNSHIEIVEAPMPAAPSPPSAAPDFTEEGSPVNVFDFLVASSTPNQSRLELTAPEPMQMITDGREEDMDHEEEDNERSLVRVRFGDAAQSVTDLIEYGSAPIATDTYQYETPAPKQRSERKEKKKDRDHKEEKKDKKRKRLHVETHDLSLREDETMTDAPPVLHSGLTGGLNRLMSRPDVFPPSPDYSGGDATEPSPGSPLKKSKQSKTVKRGRVESIGNGIMSLITSNKRVSSREHSDERPKRKQRKHREGSERPKMIEYKPMHDGEVKEGDSQMVVYTPHSPRAELLLSFVNKGPDSSRGVSMNKALKRYHRERVAKGLGLGKALEEKELWRSLRMKKNDRGEIVLFL